MSAWLDLSFALRALIVAVAGLCAGHVVNWSVARWRFTPLDVHPWTRVAGDRRSAIHYIPLLGWFFRAADEPRLGRGFWIRPLLVEIIVALLWVVMLWYSCEELGLIDERLRFDLLRFKDAIPQWHPEWLRVQGLLHANWAAWALLSLFMVAATLIDWDEQIIPDEITIPGTLLALLGMTLFPSAALPWDHFRHPLDFEIRSMSLATPYEWPAMLEGRPALDSLAIALGSFSLWCFGLLPRAWYGRYGVRRAWRYFAATIVRDGFWRWIAGIWWCGAPAIVAVWWRGGDAWQGLLSALVGLFAGGIVIWAVRVVGKFALGREAMGFGDVTLMCMIGAVAGWQAVLPIFFAAPIAGLCLGIGRWVFHGDRVLPYGPFLCLAAWGVWFGWSPVWNYLRGPLEIPWLLPGVMVTCFVLLGVLLGLLRLLRGGRG